MQFGSFLPEDRLHKSSYTLNLKAKDQFVRRATEIHQSKYEYSESDYIDATTKLLIRCPVHGLFKQTPDSHLSGSGCLKCRQDKVTALMAEKMRLSGLAFPARAAKRHEGKYGYSEVNYKGKDVPVTIICPKHGKFSQAPSKHLQGNGCPECAIELNLGEDAIAKVLTELGVTYERQYAPEWGKRSGQRRYGVIYDFAIHDLNILIERDGEQHYFPVKFGGISIDRAEQHHKNAVEADNRKTEMAKQNGWKICRIPFFCEDVAEELKQILSGNPTYPDVPLIDSVDAKMQRKR